ncbi:guanylate kinase [bacterium]|nr:guanylate kinase [bacterium]
MLENTSGILFVVSAPSAGGKTTIINKLIELLHGKLRKVVTCTTRNKRAGEMEGVDYYFLSEEEYSQHLENGAFIESASVYGNSYGVFKKELETPGHKIISLDSKGVENFKKMGVKATYILIAPPSLEVLKERLHGRGSESREEVAARLKEAERELSQKDLFDKIVINDCLEDAINALKNNIIGEIENEEAK